MQTTTFTYRDIIRFINAASEYIRQHDPAAKSKLGYAISRVRPKAVRLYEKYTEQLEDLDMDYCLTENEEDPKSAVRKDAQGNLCFSREGLKTVTQKKRELAESKVELDVYIATKVPEDLQLGYREAFERFVIPEPQEEVPPPAPTETS